MPADAIASRLTVVSQHAPEEAPTGVLPQLARQAARESMPDLAAKLATLQAWLAGDLHLVEEGLLATRGQIAGQRDALIERAGLHMLHAGGKRLRPLCTLIAGRMGPRAAEAQVRTHVRDLAIAVELVHAATLLHDDVVDLQDKRRGAATVRSLHGNEVSIFAGDWLLVEALRRIVSTGIPVLVTDALSTIEAMVFAEVEQSERARLLLHDAEGYFRVVDGKTAALFRWALRAGALASGCDAATTDALVQYGTDVGIAFQLVDDVLDLDGDEAKVGKGLFSDLAEGKVTLPLGILLERRPELFGDVAELRERCADPAWRSDAQTVRACAALLGALRETGALSAARAVAADRLASAKHALSALPQQHAEVAALWQVADVLASRQA